MLVAAGMFSPLGGLIQGCAAFRAGLSRAAASRCVSCACADESGPQPVTVCEVPVATFGFSGVGRLVALACEALKDLQTRASLAQLPLKTAFFVALPDPETRGIPTESPDSKAEDTRVEALGRYILRQSLRILGVPLVGGEWSFFGGGHLASARALNAATEAIARRRFQTCLVVCVDSLVDPPLLRELLRERRIKTADQPVGFVPGELGAAFLLSADPSVVQMTQQPAVFIRAVELAMQPAPLKPAKSPPDGRALAKCVLATLAGTRGETAPQFISDHNGEEGRAHEWGMLQVHLAAHRVEARAHSSAWLPAIGFGEAGAAAGAVGLCVAMRGLQRGYARSPSAVIMLSDDISGRAAVLVSTRNVPMSH